MDFEVLESQLNKVMKRKQELLSDIKKSPDSREIIYKMGEAPWFYNQKTDLFFSAGTNGVTFSIPDGGHVYFSYMEPNVDFGQMPAADINIASNNMEVLINGKVDESIELTLFLIGYKNHKKTEMLQIKTINERAAANFQTEGIEHFRLALRVKGSGLVKLNDIQINDTSFEGFSKAASVKKRPANSFFLPGNSSPGHQSSQVSGIQLRDFDHTMSLTENSLFIADLDQDALELNEDNLTSGLEGNRFSYLSLFEDKEVNVPLETEHLPLTHCPSSYYHFGFSAKAAGELVIDLVIAGFSEQGETIDMKSIPMNDTHLVTFKDEVTAIRPFLRVRGEGEASGLQVGITEIKKKSEHLTIVEMDENKWFNPKPNNLNTISEDGKLLIGADQKETEKNYISYNVTNNSFSKVPDESIFPVSSDSYYEVFIEAEESGSGMVTPIIISYSEHEKVQVHQLKTNEMNVLKFKDHVTRCRISLLIIGTVHAEVKDFFINSYPVRQTGGDMEWLSSKEPGMFRLNGVKPLRSLKMAAIFDEFTSACYGAECNLISFGPDNWREILTEEQPDLLMVESAWRGNNGQWAKKVQYADEESVKDLSRLIAWCRENNIPTVFWNKEDPVHFEHFINTAKLFDYVFTTDINVVEDYKRACGHDRVDVLQFAAQPKIHNPLSIGERKDGISFAGSYYKKHEKRSEDMLRIFDQAMPYGLSIYDRNYEKIKQGLLPNNRFPEYLEPYIKGSLKYYEIDKAYKGYKAMINVSTVKDSPTMFARRVYEGLASGTPIISTYSVGVEETFGDLVSVSESEEDIAEFIEKIFHDGDYYRKVTSEGIRRVLSEHTYAHRLESLTATLNLPYVKEKQPVSVISRVQNIEEADLILKNFAKQTLSSKELHLITSSEEVLDYLIEEDFDKEVMVFNEREYKDLYANINEAVDSPYIAVMDAYSDYETHHLLDISLAALYSDPEVIEVNESCKGSWASSKNINHDKSAYKKDVFNLLSVDETFNIIFNEHESKRFLDSGAKVLVLE
ncbi:glycosyltransferase [Salipaludibacillus sp. CUR1]|uniref:CgeB family protein n=1 Tax=Salipaludibacillus sp. CUR1 TaxID=2820003 RepID=UPI001E33F5DE|nr:glycosyltransferase [Salipaludibacillus sp. CUR1]MCE7791779.1 glycosyltransferase [Salipaludibacillus sp. CUR1]